MIREIIYKLFRTEPFPCDSCETLREQLLHERNQKEQLLNRVLELTAPPKEEIREEQEMRELPRKVTSLPWRVRQQMLEAEDRAKARILKEKAEEIEKLEQEVGLQKDA